MIETVWPLKIQLKEHAIEPGGVEECPPLRQVADSTIVHCLYCVWTFRHIVQPRSPQSLGRCIVRYLQLLRYTM